MTSLKLRLTMLAAAFATWVGGHGDAQAQFFKFQDNSLGYRYSPYFKEPAVRRPNTVDGADISKNIVTLSHVDAWAYGSNFLNLDFLKSSNVDPTENRRDGASEFYFIYRGQLSPDSIFGTNFFPNGPIRDITFEAGIDRSTKNTRFGAQKFLVVAGPNIHFNTPGFLNVGLHVAKEWNHNGVVGQHVNFDPTYEMEAVYEYPLAFTGIPLRFEGFTNLVGPKGRDGFKVQTTVEVLSQNRLTLDVGQLLFNKARFLDGSVGFQYWFNKFGNDHTKTKGAIETAPFIATRVHF